MLRMTPSQKYNNCKIVALIIPPRQQDPFFLRKSTLPKFTVAEEKFSRSDSSNSDEGVVADFPWINRTGSLSSPRGMDVVDCDLRHQDRDSPMDDEMPVSETSRPRVMAAPNMQISRSRLFSFVNWPLNHHQSPAALSEAGFFYTGQGDSVQCAFCHNVLGEWQPTDVPMAEHRHFYPNCPYVKSYGTNVDPEPITPPSSAESAGEDVCGWYFPCRNPAPLLVPAPPKIPHMALYMDRFSTFAEWPPEKHQTPRALASAGLFYLGESDKTACFHCGGKLLGWEPHDVPWTEHARNYPFCQFVIASKGQDFVNMARRLNGEIERIAQPQTGPEGYLLVRSSLTTSSESSSSGTPPSSQSSGIEDESPPYSSSQESGSFSDRSMSDEEDEQELIGRTVIQNSGLIDAIQEAVAESRQNLNFTRFHSEFELLNAAKAIQERKLRRQEMLNAQAELERNEPVVPTDLASITREYERLRKERTCKVCLDRDSQVIFQPCGHMVCCSNCANGVHTCRKLDVCPVCRTIIAKISRVYLS